MVSIDTIYRNNSTIIREKGDNMENSITNWIDFLYGMWCGVACMSFLHIILKSK